MTDAPTLPPRRPALLDDPSAPLPQRLRVVPWVDPLVDALGHPARSAYVEVFWLGTLGPTATWLVRRLDAGFDEHPDGYDIDLGDTARCLGLTFTPHASNPFTKAIHRCVLFGLARFVHDGLAVRRTVPPLPQRHLARLPVTVQEAHATWR